MRTFIHRLFLLGLPLLTLTLFTGCSDDSDNPVSTPDNTVTPGVYLINEGGYSNGNASLSYYIPDSTQIVNNVFKTITGLNLGDTGYSLTIHDGLLYIVVNNSSKIEVIDTEDQSYVRTIELAEGASPRYIVFGQDNLGYISDLYANTVSVYNPSSATITRTIAVGNNPEHLYYSQNHIYVANSGFGAGNTISIIEISTYMVENTLTVGDGPVAFARISAGKAAVLCQGNYGDFNDPNDDTPGMIYIIETGSSSQSILDSVEVGGHPSTLTTDNNGYLYTNTESAICRVKISDMSIDKNFITGAFYAIQYDTQRSRLYATDPKDFQQAGQLCVYSSTGMLLNKFTTGIIPARMAIVE